MKLYLDNCCYNRPFDDQSQERIHIESEAVLSVIKRGRLGADTIYGSAVLSLEMNKNGNIEKREKVSILYDIARTQITFSESVRVRAAELMAVSKIRSFDALHVATAEHGCMDYLLTTDDRLERQCRKLSLRVKVINPLKYMAEVIENEQ